MKSIGRKFRSVIGPVQIVLGLLLLVAAVISLRPWRWRRRLFENVEGEDM
jgi:hypothetical protein